MNTPTWVRVYRDPADWWIGLYIGANHLYRCPLPTLVIRIRRRIPPAAPGITGGDRR